MLAAAEAEREQEQVQEERREAAIVAAQDIAPRQRTERMSTHMTHMTHHTNVDSCTLTRAIWENRPDAGQRSQERSLQASHPGAQDRSPDHGHVQPLPLQHTRHAHLPVHSRVQGSPFLDS